MRLAIVDDLAEDRLALREQLEPELAERGIEAELIEYESGEAFLADPASGAFDAVFLDIYMDGISGMEVARRLRMIHLSGRTVEATDSFGSLSAAIDGDKRFLVCGRGILIQMRYIAAQENSDFVMVNGDRLPIPRRLRKEILRAFQTFALQEMDGML